MPRLTRKQLRLIFAKFKPASGFQASRVQSGLKPMRIHKSSSVPPNIAALISRRIPKHHQMLSKAKTFTLHNSAQSMENVWKKGNTPAGFFDRASGAIHVRVDTSSYAFPVGYTNLPAHRPRGKEPLTEASALRYDARNARVGSASTFYHEYAHSIFTGMGGYKWSSSDGPQEWNQRGLTAAGEYFEYPLDVNESFAEAYAFYATTSAKGAELRRERPMSYEFVKKFFEEK